MSLLRLSPRSLHEAWGPILLALAILLHLWLCLIQLHTYPPPWPDEALFSDLALNLASRGVLGTELLDDVAEGLRTHTYWVTPLQPLMAAASFKALGFSLASARLVSMLASVLLLVSVVAYARRWLSLDWRGASLLAVAASLDSVVVRASNVARMDVVAAALIFTGLALASSRRRRWLCVGGLFMGLALTAHLVGGALGLLMAAAHLKRRPRELSLVAASSTPPILAWLLYAAQRPSAFAAQMGGQAARKLWRALNPLLSAQLFAQYSCFTSLPALGLAASAILIASALYASLILGGKGLKPTAPLLLTLLASLAGYEMWYSLYPVLAMLILASLASSRGGRRGLQVAVLLAAFMAINLALHATRPPFNYAALCRQLSNHIPPGSTVLLAASPDPYFEFKPTGLNYTLREFIPEGTFEEAYFKLLSGVDYAVVNLPLKRLVEELEARSEWTLSLEVDGFTYRLYRLKGGHPL
jgi:hypothetical protein